MSNEKTVSFRPLYLNKDVQSLAIGDGKVVRLNEDPSGKGLIQVWFEIEASKIGYVLEETEFVIIREGEVVPGEFDHVGWVFLANGLTVHVYKKRKDVETGDPEIYQEEHTVPLPPEMEETQS